MGYLGEKNRSELMRFWLTMDTAPTGTPTITITRGQGTALDTPISAVNMTQGASTLEWYYDYTTEAAAQVGLYTVKYIAVISGVTRYAYDQYDVSVNDSDSIKTETALIKTETDKIQTVDNNVDQLLIDVAAVPTAAEIDTELTTSHGAGNWTTGSTGSGARSIIFNIKDGSANPINLCNVQVHNSADDDSPLIASVVTDVLGNTPTVLLDDATYKVRLSKAGSIVSETETVVITASATVNLTVVAQTVSNPIDPGVCRLRMYVIDLDNTDSADISSNMEIWSDGKLTIVNGQFITNTKMTFTYDSSTSPDSYYFDAVRGATVHITNKQTGVDYPNITVPDLATVDLSTLIS